MPAGVRERHAVDRRARSDLEEGESQGLPVWSRHVGDPILESNITRRVDFALFMVEALENDELVHEAPAIVGCQTPRRSRMPPPNESIRDIHPRHSAQGGERALRD